MEGTNTVKSITQEETLQLVEQFYTERGSNRGKQYTINYIEFVYRNNVPLDEWLSELIRVKSQLGRKYRPNGRHWYFLLTKKCINYIIHQVTQTPQQPKQSMKKRVLERRNHFIQKNSNNNIKTITHTSTEVEGIKIYNNFHDLQETTTQPIEKWG